MTDLPLLVLSILEGTHDQYCEGFTCPGNIFCLFNGNHFAQRRHKKKNRKTTCMLRLKMNDVKTSVWQKLDSIYSFTMTYHSVKLFFTYTAEWYWTVSLGEITANIWISPAINSAIILLCQQMQYKGVLPTSDDWFVIDQVALKAEGTLSFIWVCNYMNIDRYCIFW